MMKSMKKTAALALAVISVASMAGCGTDKKNSDPNTLRVMVTDAGF